MDRNGILLQMEILKFGGSPLRIQHLEITLKDSLHKIIWFKSYLDIDVKKILIHHRKLKEEAADLLMTAGKEECWNGLQLHSNIPVTDSLSINNTFYEVTVFDLMYPHDVFLRMHPG